MAARYIAEQTPAWRDPRRSDIWTSSRERPAYPHLGKRPVEAVTTDGVLAVLRPIWTTINETADRVGGRMERILDYARTHGWREGENPCRWKGHLAHILPKPSAVSKVEHRPAVPWREVGAVMARLAKADGVSAMAVRFFCLTATKSNEVRGATWSEVDLTARTWTIPADRMKGASDRHSGRPTDHGHPPDALVFPGGRPRRPLSDVALSKALHAAAGTKAVTVHALRSSFRDWAAETTDHPRDVAEMALAHVVGNQVEAAYRRGDLFEKRRAIMEEWAAFCTTPGPKMLHRGPIGTKLERPGAS